jgi:hypothetical protein
VSGVKGLNELGMFSHEASINATKERAEMKMIEFFIPRKLSLTALGIQSQSESEATLIDIALLRRSRRKREQVMPSPSQVVSLKFVRGRTW